VPEYDLRRTTDLSIVDLIELYCGIEHTLAPERGAIVQLVSPDSDGACAQIGFQLARAGATVLGRRVLLVNHWTIGQKQSDLIPAELQETPACGGGMSLKQSMVKIAGHELFVASLRDDRLQSGVLARLDELDRQLDELRSLLDMVLIVAPPADRDPFGVVMARHVDGSVLVLEAEHSRLAAAIRLRELLARSRRPILGSILTGRRRYIPRWLMRLL
jgi:hypothetical protein